MAAAGLSGTGTGVVFEQLVGNLIDRLRMQALCTTHPEIDHVVIEAASIICGCHEVEFFGTL